ncbi:MAG: proline--tRNA ligase, partial [Armatimonadetes bacterium]|nr:proline--tRNA ligase [Armatimonadota bacterium]
MRASRMYIPTLREAPADAEIASHRLLLRGGFIRPVAAGVFDFLPMGLRVLRKVEQIIREEMNAAGAEEVLMPVLSPRELWEQSGRWDTFEPTPLRTQDRGERWFCLGPTHEEIITHLVAMDLGSYRELPHTLYQIQVKFRDELRARGGLIRVKEFIMKDAYSFDRDEEGLDVSYQAMYDAYVRIFERLELPVVIVEAEAGSMGGHDTREFMLLSDAGEDTIYLCDSCDYGSNSECAMSRASEPAEPVTESTRELVATPGAKTIEQVSALLEVPADRLVKTLLYHTGERFVAALVRGDRDLNEMKLARALEAPALRMAEDDEVERLTGAPVGFAGPVGLPDEVFIIADEEVMAARDFVVGANRNDAHFVRVNIGADFEVQQTADLRDVRDGDPCPRCDRGTLRAHRCIELGHVFKLGTRYSEALGCTFKDADGQERVCIMGCYGIGVSRIVAALVEQYHDDNGIIWPRAVAPFEAVVLLLSPDDEELAQVADEISEALEAAGIETLLDDRDDSPGSKFAEAGIEPAAGAKTAPCDQAGRAAGTRAISFSG